MKQDKPYHACDNTKGILLRYPTFVEFAFVKITELYFLR